MLKNYPESTQKRIANLILRRRVVGEIVLSNVRDSLLEKKDIKFDDILELYGDNLYEYTTEERRQEFLKNNEIQFSDSEIKIFKNKELSKLYMEIRDIKDLPYKDLSNEEQMKIQKFRELYQDSFDGIRLSTDMKFDENGNYIDEKGAIIKKDSSIFSQAEIDSLGKKCISNISNIKIGLDYRIMDENTSLSEFMKNCENMMEEVRDLLDQKEKDKNDKQFSTEDIGKATINIPTKAKQEAERVEQSNIIIQDKTNENQGETIDDN